MMMTLKKTMVGHDINTPAILYVLSLQQISCVAVAGLSSRPGAIGFHSQRACACDALQNLASRKQQ